MWTVTPHKYSWLKKILAQLYTLKKLYDCTLYLWDY